MKTKSNSTSIDLLSIILEVSLTHTTKPGQTTHRSLQESDKSLDGRKEELDGLITDTLRRHPSLCYFQGFHDIAQVLLLVLGRRTATPAVARLALLRIRDFMLPTMTASVSQLRLLPSILHVADASLSRHLSATQPFFALPATLTMYAHDMEQYGDIARLYDFLLARESVVSLYLFAVVGHIFATLVTLTQIAYWPRLCSPGRMNCSTLNQMSRKCSTRFYLNCPNRLI